MTEEQQEGLYTKALERMRNEFFPTQHGKTFVSDDVYRFFRVDRMDNAVEIKRSLAQVLYNLTHKNKTPELEQTGKVYRIIDRELNVIEWWKALKGDTVKLAYPVGDDGTTFGFEKSVVMYPGDLIVVAGEGNSAKTLWCLNFMVENLDTMPCYYFTSEFNDAKFVDRMRHFDWVELFDKDGKPRFTVVKQGDNWQDKIQPNCINIIDWIYIDKDMFKVRGILDKMLKRVGRGILVAVLQKRSYKEFGEGGEGTKDLSSVYLTIRNDAVLKKKVLKVEKVKTPNTVDDEGRPIQNPNYKEWSFSTNTVGSRLHNIQQLHECALCRGRNPKCTCCGGTGYDMSDTSDDGDIDF